jgi:hypothetical protein
MTAKKQDLIIEQGKTFQRVVRWETSPRVWKPITGIAQNAPVAITCTGHGVPSGWRVGVVNVLGMDDINALHNPPRDGEMHEATVGGVNTILLDLSAAGFDPYTSGGYLVYWTPHDLTGYTARMTIKDRVGGTVLDVVTCVVDSAGFTTTLTIDAVTAAGFAWTRAVYDLELVSAGGIVTALLTGSIVVTKEVTT